MTTSSLSHLVVRVNPGGERHGDDGDRGVKRIEYTRAIMKNSMTHW